MGRNLLAGVATLALPAMARAAEAERGMPQLAFDNPLIIAQVVWLLVIFGLLYAVMSGVALPRVASVLAERRARIDGDLNAAQAAKASADAAIAAHAQATAKARAEAQAAIAAASSAAQAERTSRAAVLSARLDGEIAAAEARIAASRRTAMAALPGVATDTAEALVLRLAGSADRAAIESAVGQAIAQRGTA